MTHKDIYTKFMIEYDKANVTSSYPSLTEYEVATVLDKAYNALIAQKVTGNNVRRIALEGDLKNISDISPLIKQDNSILSNVDNINVVYRNIPEDMLYFVSGYIKQNMGATPMDSEEVRPLPLKLVNHEIADKFIISAYNMPWIKTPVCYIEDDKIYIVYDSVNQKTFGFGSDANITYIKVPNKFAKDLAYIQQQDQNDLIETISYFDFKLNDNANESAYKFFGSFYEFECSDTVAEELISLAVAFALENVESQRLNSKLNMRGLEA